MTHSPSPEQLAIRNALTGSVANLFIEASAGAGKTTTATWLATLLPPLSRILFLAFNKDIDTELDRRLPRTVSHSTFHSAGLSALARSLPTRPKVDGAKCRWLFKDHIAPDKDTFFSYVDAVTRLCDLAKSSLILPDDRASLADLLEHHNLSYDVDEDRLLHFVTDTLRASNSDLSRIDFSDMLYLPLLRNVTFDPWDTIFIDEAQDTNVVQREMLRRMAPRRLIAVGDPWQSIYGFRGADSDACRRLIEDFNMTVMPLSVSYRCSQAVVKEAQRICGTAAQNRNE